MEPIDLYEQRIAPLRDKYQADFAALELEWANAVQALVDRVSRALGPLPLSPGYPARVAALSHPLGQEFAAKRDALFLKYLDATDAIRRELGL